MELDCQYCADCCRRSMPAVTEQEIETIARTTGKKPEEFTRPAHHAILDLYVLQNKSNGECIFLEKEEEKFSCSIYEVRPQECVDFPPEKQLPFCRTK